MKKFALAAAAAAALTTAAPVYAQQAPVADPFVSTQGFGEIPAIVIIGGVATIVAIAAASDSK